MEKVEDGLAFIGIQCGQSLSSVRPRPQEQGSLLCPGTGKIEDPRRRKLYMQYKELMRKMAIQQRMQEREASASKRLQELKNRQSEGKTKQFKSWGKLQQTICEESKAQFTSTKQSFKKRQLKQVLTKKAHKRMNSTTKQNAFTIYHNKTQPVVGLPFINHRQKDRKKEELNKKDEDSFDIVDFGIFSEHKNSEGFLRKVRVSIEKEFLCGVDVERDEDLNKLEVLLMREIKGEGRWLTQH